MILQRAVASIYVPPVDVIEDKAEMDRLLTIHFEQKQFLKALITDDICHEDVLEFMETYVETRNMDAFVENSERQLNQLIDYGC